MDNSITQVTKNSLAGHLLIATPMVQDSCFARSVVYLCSHSKEGAMGIIINYPVQNLYLNDVLGQLDITSGSTAESFPVHFGGPVEANRGFIVHSADYHAEGSLIVQNGITVSSNIAVLHDLAQGRGPAQGMLVLGYAGWSNGQLESEIESGSWIVVPASTELVFDTQNETKWNVAISTLGIDLGHFSHQVGHA